MRVNDNVFVVTGGGNGIGREVVLGLLMRGARVAAVDLSRDGLEETTRRAQTRADRLSSHIVDVTERGAVEALPAEVLTAHGRVDGTIHVAGIIQRFANFDDVSYEQIEQIFAVNLWGTIHMVQSFLPHLTERPAACLVNVSSMGGLVPVPGQTVYGASKAGVKLLTDGLRGELRDTAVAVTTVLPGGVATGIGDNSGVGTPVQSGRKGAYVPMSPVQAAQKIIQGIERGRSRVLIGKDALLVDLMTRLMPKRSIDLVAQAMASWLR